MDPGYAGLLKYAIVVWEDFFGQDKQINTCLFLQINVNPSMIWYIYISSIQYGLFYFIKLY